MSRWPPSAATARRLAWALAVCLVVFVVAHACWRLFGDISYRIDADVYRMGGQAWLQHRPLYADGALFRTQSGLELPFTYPPLAAIVFSPLAMVSLPAASVAITATTLLLLWLSMGLVLAGLGVGGRAARGVVAAGIAGVSVTALEPIWANFSFGQINVVLMTLVIADCVPRRTPWPRGVLLGIAIALKLTPAVFLLYFALRRDARAVVWALASFAAATALGFVLAWQDSSQYWTQTVHNTDRIGTATWNTNQNAAGALARLGIEENIRFLVWALICLAVLALTVWSVRRLLAAGQSLPALICVALLGLVVSPVSWSHHWVWVLPAITVLAVLGRRRRSAALFALAVIGAALTVWSPIELLPEHHEADAAWWRQLVGVSYVWWAVAVIAVAGLTLGAAPSASSRPLGESAPAADLVPRR